MRHLGVELPIRPQRGQLVVLRPVHLSLRHIISWGDVYLAPRPGGEVTIGAANGYAGVVTFPTASGVARLLTQACAAIPALAQAAFAGTHAGLRPHTPDKLPIMGPLPGWEGIDIAAGHNSNGLLFSALTGQAIAAQLVRAPATIDLTPYRADRFLD
jgi:glycine oxidase